MAVKKKSTAKSEQESKDQKALEITQAEILLKPKLDTKFAHESAKILQNIVTQNNWVKNFGGQSNHLMYEGWQTLGKYYGYTVKTHDAEFINIGHTEGFKARATVVNENSGIEIGSAEAFCLRDEHNWKAKPAFQLASMAQTRAGSKALRQILGFVVALAGYNPTPAEEMEGVYHAPRQRLPDLPLTEKQQHFIFQLVEQKGKTKVELDDFIYRATHKDSLTKLTRTEATGVIEKLMNIPDNISTKEVKEETDEEIDTGIIAEAIT